MKEQLISFETAKLAKEKGFGCETDNYYSEDSNELINEAYCNCEEYGTSAPTQSLLQKWLREKHNFAVLIEEGWTWTHRFGWCTVNAGKEFNTYEEALEDGLIKALKII